MNLRALFHDDILNHRIYRLERQRAVLVATCCLLLGLLAWAVWEIAADGQTTDRSNSEAILRGSEIGSGSVVKFLTGAALATPTGPASGSGLHNTGGASVTFSSRPHSAGSEATTGGSLPTRPEFREAARGAAVAVLPAGNSLHLADLFQFRAGEPVLVRVDAGNVSPQKGAKIAKGGGA